MLKGLSRLCCQWPCLETKVDTTTYVTMSHEYISTQYPWLDSPESSPAYGGRAPTTSLKPSFPSPASSKGTNFASQHHLERPEARGASNTPVLRANTHPHRTPLLSHPTSTNTITLHEHATAHIPGLSPTNSCSGGLYEQIAGFHAFGHLRHSQATREATNEDVPWEAKAWHMIDTTLSPLEGGS